MRETPTTPKRKLERKQSPSYRSMEKQNLSPWKLILQLTCERIFTRLRPCSTCINRERLPVYALHPQILLFEILFQTPIYSPPSGEMLYVLIEQRGFVVNDL